MLLVSVSVAVAVDRLTSFQAATLPRGIAEQEDRNEMLIHVEADRTVWDTVVFSPKRVVCLAPGAVHDVSSMFMFIQKVGRISSRARPVFEQHRQGPCH